MKRSEFEHIAAQLRQRVLGVGLQFFGSRDDAEDAAQETMEQLWRYCEHIDASRNIEALAVRVAKNCCVNMYRRQKPQTNVQRSMINAQCSMFNAQCSMFNVQCSMLNVQCDASPQEELEAKETERMLAEALDLLKPRERQLFEMRQLEGLSVDEISSETGIPKPSITAMVSAARKKVFTELQRRMKQ